MDPNKKELVQKLKDNQDLSAKERAFLVNTLEDSYQCCFSRLIRKKEDDSVQPQRKKHKVQDDAANLTPKRTTCTQTYGLDYRLAPDISITAINIVTQSKRLVEDKIDLAIAADLMANSFNKRRNFILKERPIARFVKEKYPLLFSVAEVRNEIDRIFYNGKCTDFLENVRKYTPHILSIAKDDDPLLITTKNKMQGLKTAAQKKYAEEVGALLMISSHMQEDCNFLKLSDKRCRPSDFPYIKCQAKQNDLYFDQHTFTIFVEEIKLCEASDLKEAILCLIASYFIFNITYPSYNFSTLVAFEKLFLESDDTEECDIDLAVRQIIRLIQNKWQVHS